ncbi:hypothetical protein GCM10018779_59330 [Streptomyces griseocarneus]|nr:hypothetical protein GCM10018779_59330 [Streptomyces griseocarneus]
MTAAASRIVRLPGRARFSGTSRNPHRAVLSAAIGWGVFGQGPGMNRGGAIGRGLPEGGDPAVLGIGPAAPRQARVVATTAAMVNAPRERRRAHRRCARVRADLPLFRTDDRLPTLLPCSAMR